MFEYQTAGKDGQHTTPYESSYYTSTITVPSSCLPVEIRIDFPSTLGVPCGESCANKVLACDCCHRIPAVMDRSPRRIRTTDLYVRICHWAFPRRLTTNLVLNTLSSCLRGSCVGNSRPKMIGTVSEKESSQEG